MVLPVIPVVAGTMEEELPTALGRCKHCHKWGPRLGGGRGLSLPLVMSIGQTQPEISKGSPGDAVLWESTWSTDWGREGWRMDLRRWGRAINQYFNIN